MMLAALFLAASPLPFVSSAGFSTALETNGAGEEPAAPTALDAERAFAADAQTLGQWTAFRKWAASDATMFVPQPINAQSWLKDRKDPAKSVEWWPTASYVSCDGSLAVNTGGWKQPEGTVGYFSTVWQRQKDGGWKWVVDGGDDLKVARDRPAAPKLEQASCNGKNPTDVPKLPGNSAFGSSSDHTLSWFWRVQSDGSRFFVVGLWEGTDIRSVVIDKIAAPK